MQSGDVRLWWLVGRPPVQAAMARGHGGCDGGRVLGLMIYSQG